MFKSRNVWFSVLYLTSLFLFLFSLSANAARLSALPDRTVIGEDETLQLTVRIDEQIGFGGPDFSDIEDHFEILNQHRSNQFRSINGRTEGWTQWTLVLAPKRSGKLLIPSLRFEGEISDAIEITVNSAAAAAPGTVKEIFSEMEVSKESVFVQEQLLVTYRIFSAVQVREISLAQAFDIENANVEVISETNFRKTINNQVYRAYEVVYAVHPQKSEPLVLPSLTWNLVTAGTRATGWYDNPLRSSRGQVRRLRTEAKTIAVNPSPSNYSGLDWIPAANITLEQHWSSDPSRFVVGEPITRTITMTAKGLTASQLPAIPEITNDKVKVYSDQPQFDETKSRDGITGVRIETSAIVPTTAGQFSLAPVRVTWWDTIDNRERTTELPAQLINVAPAAIGNIPPQNDQLPINTPTTELPALGSDNSITVQTFDWTNIASYWPLLLSNLFFAALSLGLFIAWLSARQKPQVSNPSKHEMTENHGLNELTKQLRMACGDNDAQQVKQIIGHWGKAFFDLNHHASLQDIIKHSRSKPIERELIKLDSSLYGPTAQVNWQGQALWQGISKLIKIRRQQANSANNKEPLKPLYPTAA